MPHNSPVTAAIIQLVISDTPISLTTSLLKPSVRHIIFLLPLLHGQMVKIHNSPSPKKTLGPPHLSMLWHYSHHGSLLASGSPPPWPIKLSFVRMVCNSLVIQEEVPAPGESTCYCSRLINPAEREKPEDWGDGGGPSWLACGGTQGRGGWGLAVRDAVVLAVNASILGNTHLKYKHIEV